MALFSHYNAPIFLKETSDLEARLEQLKTIRPKASESVQKQIDEDIRLLEYGIAGENRIAFELKNSHEPMYVLHDLFLEHNGLTAQIDYLIVTRKCNFVLECKNLYGTIDVDNKGNFTRTVYFGPKRFKKEGLYSPVTQNERHLELMRAIRTDEQSKAVQLISRMVGSGFSQYNIPVVVIANDKTVLNDRYAPKALRDQIVKSDQLIRFIREKNEAARGVPAYSDKEMREVAERWLARASENPTDYLEKYRELEREMRREQPTPAPEPPAEQERRCPRCGGPMIKRIAKKGANAGKTFYGCANFPKCRGIINVED